MREPCQKPEDIYSRCICRKRPVRCVLGARVAGDPNGEQDVAVIGELRLGDFGAPGRRTQSTNIGSGYAEARKARVRVPRLARNRATDGGAASSAAKAVTCSAGKTRRNDFKMTSDSRRQVVKS